MFIEKLEIKDVKNFIENYFDSYEIKGLRKNNDQEIEFELGSPDTDSTLKFVLTDFDAKGINMVSKCGEDVVAKKWNKFMTLKFGDNYKKSYIKNLKSAKICATK